MIRPYIVQYVDAPAGPRFGLVHMWTAFAAGAKFLHREHRVLRKAEYVRLMGAGDVRVHPVLAYRTATRSFYARDIDHAVRLQGPGTVVAPGDHHDCLIALPPRELVLQSHYLWPPGRESRSASGPYRYAPTAANRALLVGNAADRLLPTSRRTIATAICLAMAEPWRVPALPVAYRAPDERAGSSGFGMAAVYRRHPDVDRSLLTELVRAVGFDLSYPAPVLALVRSFCEALGEDPLQLRWSEIRALLRGGHRALDGHRVEGQGADDYFTDRRT